MSEIENIIPQQAYELVRDRIGAILYSELSEQVVLSGNYDLDADVYVERYVPFNTTETPAINVTLASGAYDNKHQGSSRGTYTYNIDGYVSAKSDDDDHGDMIAMPKLHRLLGVCRAILENPIYKRLMYAPPFISHTMVQGINIAEPSPMDGAFNVMGRITFSVVVNETTQLLDGVEFYAMCTQVKLYETDKGYMYGC